MGDVITRFRLETTQFDSKLRDSAKALQNIAHQAQLGGKGFNDFSQKAIETARALGTVQSGANNTKDKLRDLVGSYNDAAKAYNSLSETAKQGEFGKAMAASLTQLQQRIKDTKEELYNLGDAAKGGGLFGEGGLTGMLQVTGGSLLAEGIAKLGNELKDTVQQSIELAKSGEGVRLAFERLNQPGLLDRLKEATHGTVSEVELMKQAIKFENFKLPLEDLATYLSFAQQKAKDTGESVDYMVNSITTGLGRQSKQILDNLGISAAELTRRMNEGADMTKAVADIIREEMAKAGDYFETAADRAARAAAEATDQMEALGREAIPVAEAWAETWNTLKVGGMEVLNYVLTPIAESIREINSLLASGSGQDLFEKWLNNTSGMEVGPNIDDNGNYIRKPSHGIKGWNWNTGHYEDEVSSINEIVISGTAPKKKKKTGSTKNTNEPEYLDFYKQALKSGSQDLKAEQYFQSVWKEIGEAGRRQIAEMMDKQTFDYGKDISKDWVVNSNGQLVKKSEKKSKDESSFVKGIDNVNDTLSNASGAINNIFSSLQQMGIEIPQGIAQVLGTLNIITSILTFIQSVMTIKSLLPFANGGIVPHAALGYSVPGNYYSGDVTPILANAGEVVLSQGQQNNILSALRDGGGNSRLVARLKGRDILISLERELSETGKGQLATWR